MPKPEVSNLHFSAFEAEAEKDEKRPFSLDWEWAVALSVIAHLVIALVVLLMPPTPRVSAEKQPDPLGLMELFKVPEKPPPIPVQFYPAPGPERSKPGPRPLPSDANRKAGGGDPALPKAETPKAVAREGIQDLAPGKEGPKQPAAMARREDQPQDSRDSETRPEDPKAPVKVASNEPFQRRLSGISASPLAGLTADAAAKARSAGEAGDGGGGWEREGGFVDSGPLAFDTQNYDWGPYAAEMIRKIKRNWDIPALAHQGFRGRVTIRFYILKDGRIEDIRIISSSGHPPYDNSSFQAIRNSNPFRPLPPDLESDREGVTISFLYNVRQEDFASRSR